MLAEQLFGKGLDLFWSRRYAEAESQFKQAIQHNQDARFEYYLGMSLMAQQNNSKRQAAYSAFQQGARLEASNRPSMGEINASMERIQGSLRSFVKIRSAKKLDSRRRIDTRQKEPRRTNQGRLVVSVLKKRITHGHCRRESASCVKSG